MAISEQRFAAELIDNAGSAHKFDDLGCMKSYLKNGNPRVQVAACFVMDYETRRWVTGPEASYVRSQEFKTPMSGGIVAFADRTRAERSALRHKGAVLSYREVFE
ncbi:MAG TPA: nitrous oxide reductase accessory protein NosL [Acidobacteriota bacterium]|nr:nitrous oxide reductase accessory protein NosL [Acidobacteriota bacterium]